MLVENAWLLQSIILRCEAEADCEHADVTGGEWRLKYERAIREIEFTKKRLQQEFDDKLEVEQQNKRQLERRVCGHTDTQLLISMYYSIILLKLQTTDNNTTFSFYLM